MNLVPLGELENQLPIRELVSNPVIFIWSVSFNIKF